MKIVFGALAVLTVGLSACNSGNPKFCDCLATGEELNQKSAQVLNGDTKLETQKELVDLRAKQKKACADFVNMDGNTMRKWKEECAAN